MTKSTFRQTHRGYRAGTMAALGAGSMLLAGCLGPTYGTDKTATEQLFDDLGSAVSLRREGNERINYAPRPDLVQPASPGVLPPPQENVLEQEGVWPESPEERRARVRAEIDEGQRDPNFIPGPQASVAAGASEGPARSGPPGTQRVYLTDPPSEYRQPATTAEYGELGETEAAKARRLKRASGEKTGWRRFVPWL